MNESAEAEPAKRESAKPESAALATRPPACPPLPGLRRPARHRPRGRTREAALRALRLHVLRQSRPRGGSDHRAWRAHPPRPARRAPVRGHVGHPGRISRGGRASGARAAARAARGIGCGAAPAEPVRIFNDTYGRGGTPLLAIVYAAGLSGTPRPRSDVSELAWFPLTRLPLAQVAFPGIRRALREYARRRIAARRRPGGS